MIYTNFREIDKAGRIVISKDIRKCLNLNAGDVLKIESDGKRVTIEKAENKCAFCNGDGEFTQFKGKCVCKNCLAELLNAL